MEKTFPRESVQQAGPDLLKIMDHVGTTIALTEKPHNILQSEHVFPYDLSILRRELTSVLRCPEERLQSYKNKNITDYIKEQNLNATVMEELMKIMKEIVDSKIRTYKTATLDFVRNISNEDFDTTIAEQGSGVRSLICLIVDVLSQQQAKIVLIDEPEIGLNPSGKHGLLRFLMQQAERKQIFVATHDPTFVNPVLWQRENVALFLFSPVDDTFVKIDLNQSKQSPSTFGGFLPPTTSLRKIHLYVEGDSDVYIFQSFLRMFLQEEYPEDWYEKFNKVGVFHLAGDFWCHLMYTIPQTPYHSVIILDGDKKDRARKTVEDMNKVTQLPNWPDRFKFCETTNQIKHPGRPWIGIDLIPIPVYCLKQQEIEDYLQPKPIDKGKGPDIAEKMESVPSEIKEIFRSLRLEKD
jgi:AAA15 family ATPase/GTPase